jgi:hypothetical protein
MDEFESYPYTRRFAPPGEGLYAGEEVVWTRRAGFGFWIVFCGFSILIAVPIMIFSFEDFGYGSSLLLIGVLSFITTVLIIVISALRTFNTRYYLTTERILETRSGKILKEIPLSHFTGRRISQFIESDVAYTKNNRPVYRIKIYDPTSGMTIQMKGMDEFSTQEFERVGDIRECPYCKYDNPGLSKICQNCGAVL